MFAVSTCLYFSYSTVAKFVKVSKELPTVMISDGTVEITIEQIVGIEKSRIICESKKCFFTSFR
ncbi:hypothetical protein J5Y03_16080 [Bacillus sp. RG28]|uniref:Uncharacterized protein n=1 Tax=Gottfriedia endophytica TaxID=2820819 RepID=A0A940SHY0_9BACI|nr:hypothetical protein [Gottfriedia endophytica]MBP0726677.1 hypothetical protein [Gottfriedia endophytica]